MSIKHQNNFSTNLTSGTTAGDTTSPINSIPTVDAPYYIAFDATNINSHYEVVKVTSDTATNINHAATTYNHTTAEEVRMVVPAIELDDITVAKDTGWISVLDTWTYASATTITVPSGAASIYSVGDKIKLTQTSIRYFVITAVADTVLTVTGGSDYTVANAAITSSYYSKMETPVGFPGWFNYTPTGPTNTTLAGRFKVSGRKVDCYIYGAVTGTPSFASWPTLPITASSSMLLTAGNSYAPLGVGGYIDTGTANSVHGIVPTLDSTTAIRLINGTTTGTSDTAVISATSPITWANTDKWWVFLTYEI